MENGGPVWLICALLRYDECLYTLNSLIAIYDEYNNDDDDVDDDDDDDDDEEEEEEEEEQKKETRKRVDGIYRLGRIIYHGDDSITTDQCKQLMLLENTSKVMEIIIQGKRIK